VKNRFRIRGLRVLDIQGGLNPPTEFLIFPYGNIDTTKGVFTFSKENADELIEDAATFSTDVVIDYDHLSIKGEKPGDGKAAGWCNLELREDGLYAVNVRWTPAASELLQNKEYRYISPAFKVDPDSNEIVSLLNVAITNIPAMKKTKPLVAADSKGDIYTKGSPMPKKKMEAKRLAAALKRLSADELTALAKKCKVTAKRLKALADGDAPSQEEMRALAMLDDTEELDDSEELDDGEELADPGRDINLPGKSKTLDELDDDSLSSFDNDDPDHIDYGDTDSDADQSRIAGYGDGSGGGDPNPPNERQRWKPVDGGKTLHRGKENRVDLDLVLLTGTRDPRKQRMRILAAFEGLKMARQDRTVLVKLMREREDEKKRALIEKGKAAGKVNPGLVRYLSRKSAAEIEEFLAHAPIIMSQDYDEFQQPNPDSAVAILTREELFVCQLTRTDPADMAKFKKAEESGEIRQSIEDSYYKAVDLVVAAGS